MLTVDFPVLRAVWPRATAPAGQAGSPRSIEGLAWLAGLGFAVFGNSLFWQQALAGHTLGSGHSWVYGGALLLILTALHTLILLLVLNRWTVRPALSLIIIATAVALHFMSRYHVYLDPGMLRNALASDGHEAGELLTLALAGDVLLYATLPLWWLWRTPIRGASRWSQALRRRLLAVALSAAALAGGLVLAYQDLAPALRNHKEMRYLITPANYLYSLSRIAVGSAHAETAAVRRLPVGEDAHLATAWARRTRPTLLVLVVGETARAANWQLSGYPRATTPELMKTPGVINFAEVSSCGSNTEVSVPCMFSAIGRRDYDEDRIRNSESLLDVLTHAGIAARWIDNQSGCKGVCRGVGEQRPDPAATPELCDGERCLDGALLTALKAAADQEAGNLVVALHMIGNHGPAYYRRYPAGESRFAPACANPDLGRCSQEEIINAYDNALAYTDQVLAGMIAWLRDEMPSHDTALLYVSDHGESLGENGIYLHGLPWSIAPQVQTRVPMILWLSERFRRDFNIDTACMARRAREPASHDHLFHTVLGLLDIDSQVRAREFDLTSNCRSDA